jgi:hypothetical protein
MKALKWLLRDWWRGYSDADLRSLYWKLDEVAPAGSIIQLTNREYAAFLDLQAKS